MGNRGEGVGGEVESLFYNLFTATTKKRTKIFFVTAIPPETHARADLLEGINRFLIRRKHGRQCRIFKFRINSPVFIMIIILV